MLEQPFMFRGGLVSGRFEGLTDAERELFRNIWWWLKSVDQVLSEYEY